MVTVTNTYTVRESFELSRFTNDINDLGIPFVVIKNNSNANFLYY